jgi:hypothetical protein
VIERCLEKKPDERFQSARDLAFTLQTVLADSEVSRPVFRAAATPRLKPWWVVGGVTAAALLLGIAGLLFPTDVPSSDWESTPLTTSVGYAEAPSLSPDGSAVVYEHNAAGAIDIYSKNLSMTWPRDTHSAEIT